MRKYLLLLILPSVIFAVRDADSITVNRWRCAFTNYGIWGNLGNNAGGYWPHPLKNYYIFGAGPWIGCVASGDTLVTLGYNPNTGASEMVPTLCRYWRQGYTDPRDRIYKYPGDWPPPLDRFPMAPISPRSNMDLWSCFGDSDPTQHTAPARPIGIDIALTVYGFSDSIARDFFFLKYDLINSNNYPLNNMYFGIVLDGDIGQYTDDMVGLILNHDFTVGPNIITVRNTGFIYDNDNLEPTGPSWQSGTPGAVAVRLLSAPIGLGLTAFKKFTIDFDPVTDRQQYLTMAGYNYQTGVYEPYDSIDLAPGDKRALLSSGPFNLSSLSQATFYYALIGAPYGDYGAPASNRDTTALAWQSYLADSIFRVRILGIEEGKKPINAYRTITTNPNPFKASLQISSSSSENLSIEIYNVNGTLVKTLSGASPISWNGKDNKGKMLASGVYFLKLIEQGKTTTQKVLLLRD